MSHSKQVVAANLKTLRAAKRLRSQQALAEASGVSAGALARYESGENGMTLEAAYMIAEALGVTLDQLAGRAPLPLVVVEDKDGAAK